MVLNKFRNRALDAARDGASGEGNAAPATGTETSVVAAPVPVWIDMLSPTMEEIAAVEKSLGLEIPTREEMEEIELSSRLYEEEGVLFMTAPVLFNSSTEAPATSAVTFILTRTTLVTLRYVNPVPIQAFARRAERVSGLTASPDMVLLGILEQVVDRLADIMEATTANLESVSLRVFRKGRRTGAAGEDFEDILRQLGRAADLATKAKESLLGLHRLTLFLSTQSRLKKNPQARLKTLSRDIASITEHGNFLANKVTFLLDATLGLINIEQNNIVKIFTVASVAFLPPTLIASIYGMNFKILPELTWSLGYPFAIGLMIMSAVLPFWYFRRRGWL
ncbi:magnesium transporter CorA family protein [Dongia soli]|uniref:Magnesium transporter CorA family protein n=1 Tax=Dongia soli TaxID=600628 RepID=A0ABU5E9L5_9PROT|nr:magnesium transporter CorA family protein [Dongia soli]MDY0882739.1 magnesium transporter CorA family protein [Dongia soli]